MASSSKEYDGATRKVIVIKPNEFFSLNQLDLRQRRERLEYLKKNLTHSNASFVSKVCNQPNTSTPQCPVYAEADGSSQRSLLKLSKYRCVAPSGQKVELTPSKKYKRKVSVVENGLEKTKLVDFANLSRATTTTTLNKFTEKDAKNEMVNVDDDLSEQKIIELIDKKYGDALEAQLHIFQENKGVGGTTTPSHVGAPSKTVQESKIFQIPSDINEYKLREEQFINKIEKEQDVGEEIKEAQRHLESILIVDEPDDGYQLFTRDELKRLPEKIFDSPTKSIKQEIVPKEEPLEYVETQPQKSSVENVIQLQSLEVYSADRPDIFTSTAPHFNSSINEADKAKVEPKNEEEQEKKIHEYDPKGINFDTLSDLTEFKSRTECDKQIKEIVIANEDVAIIKEIDEFIEEINVKNKVLRPKETLTVVNEGGEKSDHNYCLERIEINQNRNETEDEHKIDKTNAEETQKSVDKIIVDSSELSNICVDADRFEDAVVYIINKNKLVDQAKVEEDEGKSDANEAKTKKSDILAKLVLESEICVDKTIDIDVTEYLAKSQSPNVTVSEKFSQKDPLNDSETGIDNFTSESAVLIIKEDGFLEPINSDSNELNCSTFNESKVASLHLSENQSESEEHETEKCKSDEEKPKATHDKINKNEILALLEEAKAFRYNGNEDFGNDKTNKENMKHLAGSLREQFGILRKLYEKLEIDTELLVEKLDRNETVEELSDLHDHLNFMKGIVGESFVKQEKKKLKYKVISIRRKSTDHTNVNSSTNKPITKTVYDKMIQRRANKISNKLLHQTLLRMNKLMGIVEKNERFLMNLRRKALISKLKEATKKDVKSKNVSESGKAGENEQDQENFELLSSKSKTNCNKSYSEINNSLRVVLKKSDNRAVKDDTRNDKKETEDVSSQAKSFMRLSFGNKDAEKKDTAKIIQPLTSPNAETVRSTTERKARVTNGRDEKALPEKKNAGIKQEQQMPRYPLRSRKITNAVSSYNHAGQHQKDKIKNVLPFGVNYSNVIPLSKTGNREFEYVLKNDNKPCVVLYHKENKLNKPIFEKTEKNLFGNLTQENKAKGHRGTGRYETRSKAEKIEVDTEKRVLRSRKI